MTSTTSQAGHPVRLTGELDPNLSRWLWLGKMRWNWRVGFYVYTPP